jgi:hypothetical protein
MKIVTLGAALGIELGKELGTSLGPELVPPVESPLRSPLGSHHHLDHPDQNSVQHLEPSSEKNLKPHPELVPPLQFRAR